MTSPLDAKLNNRRLHGELGDISPAEFGTRLLRLNSNHEPGPNTHPDLLQKTGWFNACSSRGPSHDSDAS